MDTVPLPGYLTGMASRMHGLQRDGTLCDLSLVASDGDIMIHSVVIASVSKLICGRIMGSNTLHKSANKMFPLVRHSAAAVELFKHFLYTGELKLSATSAPELCSILAEVGLTDAVAVCKQYIKDGTFSCPAEEILMSSKSDENDDDDDVSENKKVELPIMQACTTRLRGRPRKDSTPRKSLLKPANSTESGRRRGRPPKNRIVELSIDLKMEVEDGVEGTNDTHLPVEKTRGSRVLTKAERKGIPRKSIPAESDNDRDQPNLPSTESTEVNDAGDDEDTEIEDMGEEDADDAVVDDCNKDPDWAASKSVTMASTEKKAPVAPPKLKGGARKKSARQTRIHRQCHKCHVKFDSAEDYQQHRLVCNNTLPMLRQPGQRTCRRCRGHFNSLTELLVHRKSCKAKRARIETKCRKCGVRFPSRQALQSHREEHAGDECGWKRTKPRVYSLINCDHCTYTCRSEKLKVSHMYSRHQVPLDENRYKIYRCQEEGCDFKTLFSFQLRNHGAIHTDYRAYVCEVCGKGFKQKCGLEIHLRTVHEVPGGKSYNCPTCDKVIKTATALKMHIRRMHIGERHLQCAQCPFQCFDRTALETHMFSKHGVPFPEGRKYYSCPYCSYLTRWKNQYDGHVRRHTGEMPFECSECGKKFPAKSDLTAHQKWHFDKRFKCTFEGCKFATTLPGKLQDHIRSMHTHRHIKPYACEVCEYRTNVRGNLILHIRKVHKMEVKTRRKRVAPLKPEGKEEESEAQSGTSQVEFSELRNESFSEEEALLALQARIVKSEDKSYQTTATAGKIEFTVPLESVVKQTYFKDTTPVATYHSASQSPTQAHAGSSHIPADLLMTQGQNSPSTGEDHLSGPTTQHSSGHRHATDLSHPLSHSELLHSAHHPLNQRHSTEQQPNLPDKESLEDSAHFYKGVNMSPSLNNLHSQQASMAYPHQPAAAAAASLDYQNVLRSGFSLVSMLQGSLMAQQQQQQQQQQLQQEMMGMSPGVSHHAPSPAPHYSSPLNLPPSATPPPLVSSHPITQPCSSSTSSMSPHYSSLMTTGMMPHPASLPQEQQEGNIHSLLMPHTPGSTNSNGSNNNHEVPYN